MNISIQQALTVWDDLRDAMEGKASHGSEAEIYAYRLMPYKPSINLPSQNHSIDYVRAAKALAQLIDLFIKQYPKTYAIIEGVDYATWESKVGATFNHRIKVEIRHLDDV